MQLLNIAFDKYQISQETMQSLTQIVAGLILIMKWYQISQETMQSLTIRPRLSYLKYYRVSN